MSPSVAKTKIKKGDTVMVTTGRERGKTGKVLSIHLNDGKVIVDGNHRYVAGRLVGQEPAQTAGTLSPSQAGKVQPVQNIKIDPSDWGNR